MMVGVILVYLKKYKILTVYENIICYCAILIIIFCFFKINPTFLYPYYYALLPTILTGLLIYFKDSLVNKHFLSNKIIVYIGLISYPVYLFHWPLISFIRIYEAESISSSILLRLSVIPIVFILAHLTFQYIEKPIQKFDAYIVTKFLLFSMVIVSLLYSLVIIFNGFHWRYNRNENLIFSQINSEYEKYPKLWRERLCFLREGQNPNYELSAECMPDVVNTVLIGDSHAASLYHGIKVNSDNDLAQITMFGCAPVVNLSIDYGCNQNIQIMLSYIKKVKPRIIVISAGWGLYDFNDQLIDNLNITINKIKPYATKIILVGPFPAFHRSQYKYLINTDNLQKSQKKLDNRILLIDSQLHSYFKNSDIEYISPILEFCNDGSCPLTFEISPGTFRLFSFDYAHLTQDASIFYYDKLLKSHFKLHIDQINRR
jgi:hypothetical protein